MSRCSLARVILVCAFCEAQAFWASQGSCSGEHWRVFHEHAHYVWSTTHPSRRLSALKRWSTSASTPQLARWAVWSECLSGRLVFEVLPLLGYSDGQGSNGSKSVVDCSYKRIVHQILGSWWSELLLSSWTEILLDALAALLTPCVSARYSAALVQDDADELSQSLSSLQWSQSPFGLPAWIAAVDDIQRKWLQTQQISTLVPLLRSISATVDIGTVPPGDEFTSGLWVVTACPDEVGFLIYCEVFLRILQKESNLTGLRRHRIFVALGADVPDSHYQEFQREDTITIDKIEFDVDLDNSDRYLLRYSLKIAKLSQLVQPELRPKWILKLDPEGTDQMLSGYEFAWDLNRWLLHFGKHHASLPDVLWVVNDVPRPPRTRTQPLDTDHDVLTLACAKPGYALPSAGALLVRAEASGEIFRELLSSAQKFLRGRTHLPGGYGPVIDQFGPSSLALGAMISLGKWHKLESRTTWWSRTYARLATNRTVELHGVLASRLVNAANRPDAARGTLRQPRKESYRCEYQSKGTNFCRIRWSDDLESSYGADNCAFPAKDISSAGSTMQLGANLDVFLCPQRQPLAILPMLRSGSLSVANWAASIDNLQQWGHVIKHIWTASLRARSKNMDAVIVPQTYCLPCCRLAIGRLTVVIMRSPFTRLRSYFQRCTLNLEPKEILNQTLVTWAAFADWSLWALNHLINRTEPQAAQACGTETSGILWAASDLLHLRPLPLFLKQAALDLRSFADASARGANATASPAKTLVFARLEVISSDIEYVDGLLCAWFGRCDGLPPFPRTHVSKEKIADLVWSQQLEEKMRTVYADDFRLGGYMLDPVNSMPTSKDPAVLKSVDRFV